MEKFVDFLIAYKEILVSALCVLLTIISIIVKRRPKTLDEFYDCMRRVLSYIPSLIIDVEVDGHGEEKKQEVIQCCVSIFTRYLGRSLTSSEQSFVEGMFGDYIEEVLLTPKKKEVQK